MWNWQESDKCDPVSSSLPLSPLPNHATTVLYDPFPPTYYYYYYYYYTSSKVPISTTSPRLCRPIFPYRRDLLHHLGQPRHPPVPAPNTTFSTTFLLPYYDY